MAVPHWQPRDDDDDDDDDIDDDDDDDDDKDGVELDDRSMYQPTSCR
jgi:hypothetical protein